MKRLSEIAKDCNVKYQLIVDIIRRLEIEPTKVNKLIFVDSYQEDIIHQYLYFAGTIQEVIFESKMNIPEPEPNYKEIFNQHKAKVYN